MNEMTRQTPVGRFAGASRKAATAVEQAILGFVAAIPETDEAKASEPADRARSIARMAAIKAAGTSATLALPPGPLGLVTILPDVVAIWKIQAKMVADIAAAFGKRELLTQEQMLYCLFRHAAADAVQRLVVRAGGRVRVRKATLGMLQSAARRIAVRLMQRLLGRAVSRWIPVVGALGVGGYAYYDTGQVAATAIELFKSKIEIVDPTGPAAVRRRAGRRKPSRRRPRVAAARPSTAPRSSPRSRGKAKRRSG